MTRQGHKIEGNHEIKALLRDAETLAVIGMKPPDEGPAWSVPEYMRGQGYTVLPVNPKYPEIAGQKSAPTVMDLDEPVDVVVIFRQPRFIDEHAEEILQMDPLPRAVWMQLGIVNDRAARRLIAAGIDVVQDRCLAIEHPRLLGG